MDRIPVAGPWITQKEIERVTEAVTSAWYGNANLYQGRFETAFAAYVGRKYAVPLPSCTAALHLALAGLNLKPGDEVVVPETTWIATSAPISYVGAQPVFADIDPGSWCLDVSSFERAISARTRAVIPVDLYGNMPDMDAILELAAARGIAVIEDAAEAVGSEYRGRRAGNFGLASTFSFHGSKTLTTGEGGMLVTDDEALYRRSLKLRDHGRAAGSKMFWNDEIGYKYRLSSMQAALGMAQLERIEELIARKREIFGWYQEALEGFEGITLNSEAPTIKNTYWMVTAIIDERFGLSKEELMAALDQEGIDSRPFFYPLSSLPAYASSPQAKGARSRNPVAYSISPRGVNLPSALNLTQEKVGYVCDRLSRILARQPVA